MESLQFSATAKEIIVKLTVIPIEATSVYHTAPRLRYKSDAKTAVPSDQTYDLQSQNQMLTMEPALPASLSQGSVVAHDKELSTQLNIHSDSGGRDVELIRTLGDREEGQSIVSLPEWNDA